MNGILKNTLAIAGLLSIITFSAASADDRLILDNNVTLNTGLSGITTTNAGNGAAVQNYGYNLSVLGGNFNDNILEATNQAVFGGAIYQEYGTLNIANGVIFNGNRIIGADQTYPDWSGTDSPSGGAIYATATQNLNIGDVKFLNNRVSNGVDGGQSNGGAMFLQGVTSVTMGNVEFSNNSANTRGGAIYNGDSAISINGAGVFNDNTAKTGGAVYMYDVTGTTVMNTGTGTAFNRNHATGNGGAFANFDGTLNVGKNNTFVANTTDGKGGAIYNASFNGTSVSNIAGGTSFTGNSAQKGGAVYNSGLLNLDSASGDITFSGNTAQQGSSIYLDGTAAKLTIKGDANSVIFEDDGAIAGDGNIEKLGNGTLTFVDNSDVSGFTGTYTQKGGTLELSGSSKIFNNYDIQNGELRLINGASTTLGNAANQIIADGVLITVGNTAVSRAVTQNAVLNLDGVTLGDRHTVKLLSGGQINVDGDSTLIFNSNNTWEGDVENAGSVILNGYNHSTANGGGNYIQNQGSLQLNNNSTLTLGNAASKITDGTVTVGAGNTLNLQGYSVISGGTTGVAGTLNVGNNGGITGGTTTVQNGGKLAVNSGGSISGGTTSVESGANLNVNSGGAISGSANTSVVSGGTLTVNGGTISGGTTGVAGTLNVGNNGTITGGTTTVQDGGRLALNSKGTISGGTNTVQSGGVLSVNKGGTISGGTTSVESGANLNVNSGGAINGSANTTVLSGGTVTVNGGTINSTGKTDIQAGSSLIMQNAAKVTLNNGDGWAGSVNNTGSTLTLNNIEHNTSSGSYTQSGGTLNLDNNASLSLDSNASLTNASINVTGSTLALNNGALIADGTTNVKNGGNLNINSGAAINGSAKTTVSSGGTVTVDGGTINSTGKTDIQAGSSLVMQNNSNVTLHNGDNWAGSISNDGSTLTLNNFTHDTSNGAYTQSGGTLKLDGNSSLSLGDNGSISDGLINVENSTFVLADGGSMTGGTINMGDNSTFEMQNGGVMTGGKVEFTGTNTTIGVNGTVIADAIFDITNGKVAIGSTGDVTVNSDGTTGDVWASDASVELNGGIFNFQGTKNGTNGTFLGNSGTLNIAGGEQALILGENGLISNNVTTTINNGSSLDVAGGNVTLNRNTVWNGDVNVSAGTLSLNNATKASTGKYVQTGGTAGVIGDFALNNADDSVTGGTLNIGSASEVGAVNMSTGTIASTAALNIAEKGSLNVGGGEATLNGSGDGIDTWIGTVNVTGGTLNVNGLNSNGKLLATGGTLNVSDSEITLANGSNITSANALTLAADSIINVNNNGQLTIGTNSVWEGAVNLNNGGRFTFEGTKNASQGAFKGNGGNLIISGGSQHFVIADGSSIIQAVNTTINSGSALDITGGSVELGSATVWNGDVNIASGDLLLNNATKNTAGKFIQTGGNTTVTGNFAMNNSADSVSGGTFNIGTTSANGTVNQSAGTISTDAVVNIEQTGTLNITGGETSLTGTGEATDSWKGTIGLAQTGVLNLNEITSNGKLLAQGGSLNITSSELAIQDGSYIAKDADVAFSSDSILNIGDNGSVVFDNNSEWAGTVNLIGGSLEYLTQTNSVLHADSGNFTSSADSILNINGGSYIANAVNTNIQGLLNISGTSAEDTGRVSLNDGDTLLGNTNINDFGILDIGDNVNMADNGQTITFNGADSTMNLVGNNNLNLKAEIVGETGQINKEGSGNVIFSGGTRNFTGNLLVDNSGNLTFVDADGFGGNLQFGNIDGKKIGIFADKIHGAINQDKNAEITYSTYRDIDLFFNEQVHVSDGKLIALSHNGNDIIFNEVVDVTNGASFLAQSGRDIEINKNISAAGSDDGARAYVGLVGQSVATKDIIADNTLIFTNAQKSVFENLNLTNSTLQMAQNGFRADSLNFAGNSDVLLMNGTINDTNAGYITLADGATGNFSVDISPREWKSDRILAGSIIANGKGTLNISDFQFLNKCPIDKNVPLTIFNTSNPGYENIMFTATNKEIFTPIGYYGLFPTAAGNGTYTASLTRYNPQVFRGQVATIASWQNQLVVSNLLFDHVQEINMQYLSQSNPNKYAAAYPQFAPYQYNKKDGSLWVKPFGVVERLGMTQGLNVNNTFWGALIGADFPAVEMKKGWTMLPTTYIGYTGGHQSFSGVGMTQNGLQAGAMTTFMKDKFIGSVLAYGGGYFNNMDVAGYSDNTGNWFAGAAAKAAYNYRPARSKHFIIQPSFLASYNYYGQQNWHTNFGDMSMRADMMHGVNVAPGVNFIYGRETWSVYATIQYFYNILGFAGGRAGNDVWLPHVRMRHGFLQYGIGATKTWKDRFSAYFQFVIRNGGRTGVGFQGGINFKL